MTLEHYDVLIVGAGLSGIDAAYRLQTMCPTKTYLILEGREAMGGTWDLFRYPGIRSDSDMFTLGFPFRPWKDAKAIADGASILRYINETASAYGIDERICYRHRVTSAAWSSAQARWVVDVAASGEEVRQYSCNFLYLCSGYYSYESGHMPEFPNLGDFEGTVVHPQAWPEDLDYAGKRVVIIGSGATAVTLVPAIAETAAHVTMLQRSPTYVTTIPAVDRTADALRAALPEHLAHRIVRWKNVLGMTAFYQLARHAPGVVKRLIAAGAKKELPEGYPIDPDFSPRYDPWDQRLCFVPDADLFKAISDGRASVVTDTIDSFTPRGIRLSSGRELEADVVVSATGLKLVAFGGISLSVDGETVQPGKTFVYKGFMVNGVPNLAMCVGYTNASWTLRADLTSKAVCRLVNHMDRNGYVKAVATLADPTALEPAALLDLSSGYILRAAADLPKQTTTPPWRLHQNYLLDFADSRLGNLYEALAFESFDAPAAERNGRGAASDTGTESPTELVSA